MFRPGTTLLAFTPGVNYETDKQFDRDNLLATIDSQYFFKGLYSTQQQQCFRWHYVELLKNKAAQLSDCPVPDGRVRTGFPCWHTAWRSLS